MYTGGERSKLTDKVIAAFDNARAGELLIYVSAAVLWEIAILNSLGHVKLKDRFDRWAGGVLSIEGFKHIPLTIESIHLGVGYGMQTDPFDRIIVATAVELDLPLITKDAAIAESKLVEVYW